MGNCCGTQSRPPQQHEPLPILPHDKQSSLPEFTSRTNTPFIGTPDPMELGVGPSNERHKSGIVEDERLLSLLEFFKQLHLRKRDIFRQIIPVHRKAFEDIFDKMNKAGESGVQGGIGKVLQRSRSSEDLKKERFKVKPINSPNDKVKPPAGSKSK